MARRQEQETEEGATPRPDEVLPARATALHCLFGPSAPRVSSGAMNRTRSAALTAILALGLALTACTPQGGGVPGKWGSTDPGEPNLIINANGSYSGSDGCNTMKGTGTISGNTIDLGTVAATQKVCNGVDTWMSTAASGKVDGNVMTVYDSSGARIGTIDRDD